MLRKAINILTVESFVRDLYPCLDVRKVVGRREDGLSLELILQLAVGSALHMIDSVKKANSWRGTNDE